MTTKTTRAAPMPLAVRYDIMAAVKAASPSMPDAELAKAIGAKMKLTVGTHLVTNYRREFGIPSVKMQTAEELRETIADLRGQIQGLQDMLERQRNEFAPKS